MFQNINVDAIEPEEQAKQTKTNKLELLKENFKIENIILYILTLGVSCVTFTERDNTICISYFSSSMQ